MKKIIVGALCSTMLLGGVIIPTTSVLAEEAVTKTEDTYLPQLPEENIDQDELVDFAEEIGVSFTEDEVTITDGQLLQILEFQGITVTPSPSGQMSVMKAGVTKVKKNKSGSWNIYLSASFIRNYYWSIGAAAAVLGVMAPGIGTALAAVILSEATGLAGANTNNGIVIYVRNNKISSMAKQ